jgi:hypothetical protein
MPYRHTRRPFWKKYKFESVSVTFAVMLMLSVLIAMNWFWHLNLGSCCVQLCFLR